MIYLIQYNRETSRIVRMTGFTSAEEASREKLNLELNLLKLNENNEVVILEAVDEAALKRTHGRYFHEHDGLVISPDYEDDHGHKLWKVLNNKDHWIVEVDGTRVLYPTKEIAVAAAAKDARAWKRSSGKRSLLRIVELSGTWIDQEFD